MLTGLGWHREGVRKESSCSEHGSIGSVHAVCSSLPETEGGRGRARERERERARMRLIVQVTERERESQRARDRERERERESQTERGRGREIAAVCVSHWAAFG